MTNLQMARYNAMQRGQSFCTTYNDELVTITEYASEKTAFDEKVQAVGKAEQNQATDTSVITDEKEILKQAMVDVVYKYELRGNIKAHQLGLDDLELSLDKPKTYMSKAEGDTAITRATDLKQIMKDNLGVLTNLTTANIDEMEAAIEAYSKIKNKNKEAVNTKKATGTDVITPLLDEADVPKGQIEKIVFSYFPELAGEWMQQTKVGKAAGIRHVKLIMKFFDFDTNVVLDKVKTTLTSGETKKGARYSTKLGYNRFKGLENGNYTAVSELAGYITDTKANIAVSDDGIVRFEIKLKKVV